MAFEQRPNQGTARKTGSKKWSQGCDKSFVKISQRAKLMPQSTVQIEKNPQRQKGCASQILLKRRAAKKLKNAVSPQPFQQKPKVE